MRISRSRSLSQGVIALWLLVAAPLAAMAQTVPGPADAGRVRPPARVVVPAAPAVPLAAPDAPPLAPIPKGADGIHFTLNGVRILGATAFAPETLADITTPFLHQTISLADAYRMAHQITQRYRDAGYFLSLAYLPDQRMADGIVTLQVLEGYIGEVILPESLHDEAIVQAQMERLRAQKPLSARQLESALLRLNDLPGYAVSGTLSSLDGAKDGAVRLTLAAAKTPGRGQLGFDNASSRFLGPHEATLSYTQSLLPLQQTRFTGLNSLPTRKLSYATLGHAVAIAPDTLLDVAGSFTKAQPGFTLDALDIDSDSTFLSAGLRYQWLRQRDENLAFALSFDSRNTDSDLLDAAFTRDHIRALRVNASYDIADAWRGTNAATLTLSQGIAGLGASKKGGANLSRAQADPDFTKAELSLTRLQGLTGGWSLLLAASAQAASGPLFSAEEFGYGGQSSGRAFDASELAGDHGATGALELRYGGWNAAELAQFSPYAFYDIGVIWNEDAAQAKRQSGASIGLGMRATTVWDVSGNLGLAWPLMRDVATPIYGGSNRAPRLLLQISKDF